MAAMPPKRASRGPAAQWRQQLFAAVKYKAVLPAIPRMRGAQPPRAAVDSFVRRLVSESTPEEHEGIAAEHFPEWWRIGDWWPVWPSQDEIRHPARARAQDGAREIPSGRLGDRLFDKFYLYEKERWWDEAGREMERHCHRGRSRTAVARCLARASWREMPDVKRHDYAVLLGDRCPLSLMAGVGKEVPEEGDTPVTPRKPARTVSALELRDLGEAFVTATSKWVSPEKAASHSRGPELALRQLATAVVGEMEAGPSRALRAGLGLAILAKSSKKARVAKSSTKARDAVKEATLATGNPLPRFGGSHAGGPRQQISDAELRAILTDHCRQGRGRPDCPREEQIHRLGGSLARAIRSEPRLDCLSASRIYRRVRLHRPTPAIGIGHSNKLTDRCKECRCWDAIVAPSITTVIADNMEALEGFVKTFWDEFAPICRSRGYNARGFEKIESEAFLEDLKFYAQHWCDSHPEVLESLEGEDIVKEVQMTAARFAVELEDIVKEVRVYVGHWTLRDYIHGQKAQMRLRATCGVLVVESDWGVNLACSSPPPRHPRYRPLI